MVVVSRLMPRSALDTTTCALAMLAPDASRTVPVKEAASWACTNAAENTNTATAVSHSRRTLIADSFSPIRRRTDARRFSARRSHQRVVWGSPIRTCWRRAHAFRPAGAFSVHPQKRSNAFIKTYQYCVRYLYLSRENAWQKKATL